MIASINIRGNTFFELKEILSQWINLILRRLFQSIIERIERVKELIHHLRPTSSRIYHSLSIHIWIVLEIGFSNNFKTVELFQLFSIGNHIIESINRVFEFIIETHEICILRNFSLQILLVFNWIDLQHLSWFDRLISLWCLIYDFLFQHPKLWIYFFFFSFYFHLAFYFRIKIKNSHLISYDFFLGSLFLNVDLFYLIQQR